MKMKKLTKFLAMTLAVVTLTASLSACGTDSGNKDANAPAEENVAPDPDAACFHTAYSPFYYFTLSDIVRQPQRGMHEWDTRKVYPYGTKSPLPDGVYLNNIRFISTIQWGSSHSKQAYKKPGIAAQTAIPGFYRQNQIIKLVSSGKTLLPSG